MRIDIYKYPWLSQTQPMKASSCHDIAGSSQGWLESSQNATNPGLFQIRCQYILARATWHSWVLTHHSVWLTLILSCQINLKCETRETRFFFLFVKSEIGKRDKMFGNLILKFPKYRAMYHIIDQTELNQLSNWILYLFVTKLASQSMTEWFQLTRGRWCFDCCSMTPYRRLVLTVPPHDPPSLNQRDSGLMPRLMLLLPPSSWLNKHVENWHI